VFENAPEFSERAVQRRAAGYRRQRDLAAAVGIARQSVVRWEKHRENVTAKVAIEVDGKVIFVWMALEDIIPLIGTNKSAKILTSRISKTPAPKGVYRHRENK
jgi:DNA-binding XRE family transcriptional regulator